MKQNEKIFRCSCGDLGHILALTIDRGFPGTGAIVEMTVTQDVPFWLRFKECWRSLRGKNMGIAEVVLSEQDVQELCAFLKEE